MRLKLQITAAAVVIVSALASPVSAQWQAVTSSTMPQTSTVTLRDFAPRPRLSTVIDYEVWDQLLKEMVLYGGPSLRERAPRPPLLVGTNLRFGHQSPYRMEGNRILFEELDDTFSGFIDDYVDDLVRVGNRVDIPALAKDEQLAYWLNLHNALSVQAVVEAYPTGQPSRERGPDGLQFHDSKRVTLRGVALSLRDIREGIVYEHWRDPRVIYGFFHGDVGGPSIQRAAYTGKTVWATLKFSGDEFVNSLRGFHANNDRPQYSEIYRDAGVYMFPNFETDLRAHLETLMSDDVRSELRGARGKLQFLEYDGSTADLTRGDDGAGPASYVTSGPLGRVSRGPVLQQAIRERKAKIDSIRKRGLYGTVTIEDLETDDEALASAEPESDTPATSTPRE